MCAHVFFRFMTDIANNTVNFINIMTLQYSLVRHLLADVTAPIRASMIGRKTAPGLRVRVSVVCLRACAGGRS